jgi:hypothetical protein
MHLTPRHIDSAHTVTESETDAGDTVEASLDSKETVGQIFGRLEPVHGQSIYEGAWSERFGLRPVVPRYAGLSFVIGEQRNLIREGRHHPLSRSPP